MWCWEQLKLVWLALSTWIFKLNVHYCCCILLGRLFFWNFNSTWVACIHFHYLLWMYAEVFEEVLEIVSYMTFFSPTISLDMWSLWPLLMEALADWAIDFFPSMSSTTFWLQFISISVCSTIVKHIVWIISWFTFYALIWS